jgi:hypothetical protein
MFVADPTRYSTLEAAATWNLSYWHREFSHEFTEKEFEWLHSTFPQSIFKDGDACYLQEFVSLQTNNVDLFFIMLFLGQLLIPLALSKDRDSYTVSLMTWESFIATMLNKVDNPDTWKQLLEQKLVIGGMDLTIDYL